MLEWFTGKGRQNQKAAPDLTVLDSLNLDLDNAGSYRLFGENREKVAAAVNTALLLQIPLLVSGEPGAGKTRLAYAIAHELGLSEPFLFETGSNASAQDLFYSYDAVGHFRATQAGGVAHSSDAKQFITYNALGLAIIHALPPEQRAKFVGTSFETTNDKEPPRRSIVLIDEIDKAPRDFPNDLLSQIANMRFSIPELAGQRTPEIARNCRPIVVITTNSERQLPDAFLRRCAYVHLVPPEGEELAQILAERLAHYLAGRLEFVSDLSAFSDWLRNNSTMDKLPSTAEILQFAAHALIIGAKPDRTMAAQAELLVSATTLLAKRTDDVAKLRSELKAWLNRA